MPSVSKSGGGQFQPKPNVSLEKVMGRIWLPEILDTLLCLEQDWGNNIDGNSISMTTYV